VPPGEKIVVDDMVRGKVSFESDGVGDFIIVKSDGIPIYNYAVVIDDALMEISYVIRGEEHLSNTPRQVLLYQALDIECPHFAHISLILGKDRSKMSKRHGATSVIQYQKEGYLPEALVNFLALLGWSPDGEEEIFTLEELVKEFGMDRVAKNPAVFDMEKLKWLNGVYIRQADTELITQKAIPYLKERGYLPDDEDIDWEHLNAQIAIAKNYLSTISEVSDFFQQFFGIDVELEDDNAREILQQEQVPDVVEDFKQKLISLTEIEPGTVKKMLKSITKDLNLGGKKVFQPLRVAITGKTKGPELHDLIPVLGVEACVKRVNSSLQQAAG